VTQIAPMVDVAVAKLAKYRGASRPVVCTTIVRGRYGSVKWKCRCCDASGVVRGSSDLARMCLISFVRRHLACEAA